MSQNNALGGRAYFEDLRIFDGVTTNNNKAFLIGRLRGKFESNYTSSFKSKRFYKGIISVPRKSGIQDNIRIMVPEELIQDKLEMFERGSVIKVSGTLCSYLHTEAEKKRLRIYVHVETIELYQNQEQLQECNNCIYLKGRVHKKPFMRKTSVAGKTITDLFLTVVRKENKLDYITCITWGSDAYWANTLNIGDEIILKGRIQSRMYIERYNGSRFFGTQMEVHEVSVFEILGM